MDRLLQKSVVLYACYNEDAVNLEPLKDKIGNFLFFKSPDDLVQIIKENSPDIVFIEVDRLDLYYKPILIANNTFKNIGFVLITTLICSKILMEVMKRARFCAIFDKNIEHTKVIEFLYSYLSKIKDTHTGVASKTYLLREIKEPKEFVLMVFEIDNAEYYFGIYGFEFGEEIIATTIEFIDKIKPCGSKLFQVQEDQFVILLEDENINKVKEFAQMLITAIGNDTIEVNGIELSISISIGISKGFGEEMLTMARLALKEAKSQGARQYCIYEGKTTDEILQEHNLKWTQKVKLAIESDQIQPYFQPIYNNHTNKVEKYECLARMIDEDGEVFNPGLFLGSAKIVGLLPNISFVIISKSFKHFKDNNYEFAINISEDDLKAGKFVEYIINRCDHFGISPKRVCIEILEGISSSSNAEMIRQIKELKSLGFKIALDDFGTESSNFSRIFDLEIDYIKIDGSFIKNLDTDVKSLKIVKTIANFAKSIGVKTIAEFVHSKAIQDIVLDLGIDYSQGYYFGKPLPAITS